jgi:hypothetical protein
MRYPRLLALAFTLAVAGCGGRPAALHDAASVTAADTVAPELAGSTTIHLGDRTIDVQIPDDHFDAPNAQLMNWVETGAKAVSNYYGSFPVKHAVIRIGAEGDSDQIHGTEFEGNLIRMRLGRHVTPAQLADDWTMTHEMLHLAFPNMGEKHLWMNEGLSVYLEPIARARIGIVSPKRYWRELKEGVAHGQPEAGDGGLDHTHAWGRTYWGGTIFWFLVDAGIREQTHGRKSLDDVVKAILAAGGDGSHSWSMSRVLDPGDAASGTRVMHDTYELLALKPTQVDFSPWWRRLGVQFNGEDVTFDDSAPLAWMRKAMLAQDGRGEP